MKVSDESTLGQKLRARREETELTQDEVGQVAGFHRVSVQNAEKDRQVELRTITNILRTLGCEPPTAISPATVTPVLSASLTYRIVKAIVGLPEAERKQAAADYFELVNAASSRDPWSEPTMPDGFRRFRESIAFLMAEPDLRTFDIELFEKFGNAYPHRWTSGSATIAPTTVDAKARVMDASATDSVKLSDSATAIMSPANQLSGEEVRLITTSGLSADAQDRLIRYMATRRTETIRDLRMVIDLIKDSDG